MKFPGNRLTKDGIWRFFFRHGEKVLFSTSCLLILLFIGLYKGDRLAPTTTPTELLTTAMRAESYIKAQDNWDKIQQYRLADHSATDRMLSSKPVDARRLAFDTIVGVVIETAAPRVDPVFISPEKFTTQYFQAQVVLHAKEGKPNDKYFQRVGVHGMPKNNSVKLPAKSRFEMWMYRPYGISSTSNMFVTTDAVVGMALLPYAEQKAEYKNTFQFARNYDERRDTPEYAFVEVQRKTRDTDWQSITAHVHELVRYRTAPAAMSIADTGYTAPGVTLPVPPFVGFDYRDWSKIAEIPAQNPFKNVEPNESASDDSQSEGENFWDPFGDQDQDQDQTKKQTTIETDPARDIVPVKLVRFYDLEKKKFGESYLYRIRVWLRDPNNPDGVSVQVAAAASAPLITRGGGGGTFADDDAPAGGGRAVGTGQPQPGPPKPLYQTDLAAETRIRVRQRRDDLPQDVVDRFSSTKKNQIVPKDFFDVLVPTDWVEAENWVTVSGSVEDFVAGPVRPPTATRVGDRSFFAGEPIADITVLSYQDDLGVVVPATARQHAGSVLNFRAITNVLHPIDWTIRQVFQSDDYKKLKAGREFKTNAIVLDIMGGQRQRMPTNEDAFHVPAEVLIMDRNGNIFVQNEIDDATAYRQANFIGPANKVASESGRGGGGDDDSDSR